MSAAVSWLAKHLTWLGEINWAEAIFIGLFGAAILVFLFTASLALYRLFRPIAKSPLTEKERQSPLVQAEIENVVGAKIENALGEPKTQIAQVKTIVTELKVELERVEQLSKEAKGHSEAASTTLGAMLSETNKKLDGRIEYFEDRISSLNERFKNVDNGFSAILNREWHERFFKELGEAFDLIAEPVNAGQGIGDDRAWLQSVKDWRGKLDQWLTIVDYYAMGATEKVLKIPDALYDDVWTFDEKPLTANQVHRYKEAAIWWHNAKAAKGRIDRCFSNAAFGSPSRGGGRLDSPPKLDEAP
ncbi:MAG: hypothetical protein R3E09_03880 [Novosphingobium sp.]